MASERSKRRDLLALSFITKSISKKLLISCFQSKKIRLTNGVNQILLHNLIKKVDNFFD